MFTRKKIKFLYSLNFFVILTFMIVYVLMRWFFDCKQQHYNFRNFVDFSVLKLFLIVKFRQISVIYFICVVFFNSGRFVFVLKRIFCTVLWKTDKKIKYIRWKLTNIKYSRLYTKISFNNEKNFRHGPYTNVGPW